MTQSSPAYRAHSWTPALRERFIQSLAACGYVAPSAAICGMSRQSVYRLRARDAGFAAQWAEAIGAFHARAEEEVLSELAHWIEAQLAAGNNDPRFYQLLAEIAGDGLLAMLDPAILAPRTRHSCQAVSTTAH